MWAHLEFQRGRQRGGVFLSALLLLLLLLMTLSDATPRPSPGGQPTSFEQLFSMDPNNATFTPLCDDALLGNVAKQVTQLKVSSENVYLLLDTYNLRLDHIKKLLDERLPEVKSTPQWIDVRVQGEGGASTPPTQSSSAGGIHFPGVISQSSATGANLPACSPQTSATAGNLPAFTSASSAAGGNLPASSSDSQSSAGGSNLLPTIAESSSAGGSNQLPANSNAIPPPSTQTPLVPSLYAPPCPYSSPALPSTCAEAVESAGVNAKSGIYQLYLPDSGLKPFYAYCQLDANGGPAWIVVQRRQDGSITFNREWHEYQAGFGNWNGEFFIGLERLHGLTHARLNELWVQMEDFENVTRYARYENFAIGDEHEAYALNVLGKFEGNAGDSLRSSQGQKFSTKDADHDMWDRNCAVEYTGAWWYKACHDSNLNGQYLRGKYSKDKYGKGIDWTHWHGHEYSLKYVHMAIRPIQL
ncbi:ficolin-2-like [Rhagoletis pomonella]|uniref:ficolin-2-like n=1 Tax=Rhagoletis pomonella TaxID=28610 RepID=UPI00177DAF76|nr:ficolin-2-like [Rhagoletis pomonella]